MKQRLIKWLLARLGVRLMSIELQPGAVIDLNGRPVTISGYQLSIHGPSESFPGAW